MDKKCYICEENFINIGVIGKLSFATEWFIKTGFFSKESLILCFDCEKTIDELYGERQWGRDWYPNIITNEYKIFMDENKEKIKNRDYGGLPACPYCSKQAKNIKLMECYRCRQIYCVYCEKAQEWRNCPACLNKIKNQIIDLLKEKSIKITISDLAAFLSEDREYVKALCKMMYEMKEIDFAGSGRYFIYSEEKKSSKKASTKKADPTTQIRKYAKLRDDGLITEEEYQAKKKEILGL